MSPWLFTASFLFFSNPQISPVMPGQTSPSIKPNQNNFLDSVKLELKPKVSLKGLDQKMHPTLKRAGKIWQKYGKTLVITSTIEGKHCKGSKHYSGLAVDLRTKYFKKKIQTQVSDKLSEALGEDFQVLLENDHIHVEYHPLPNVEKFNIARNKSSPNTRGKLSLAKNP